MAGGQGQLLRRIPRINFPNRTHPQQHPPPPPPPDAASQKKVISFFSNSKTSASPGGKASLQPKRTPVSEEEIESILKTPALVPTTIDGRMLLN